MAKLLPQGKQVYTDSAGDPLSGGLLYTYAAGTSTPLATYSDQAGITPNANPVVLDARGEATVFWSESSSYKVVLHDAADAPIWTQDNIVPEAVTATGADTARTQADWQGAVKGWRSPAEWGNHASLTGAHLASAATRAATDGVGLLIAHPVTISTAIDLGTVPIRVEGRGRFVRSGSGTLTGTGPLTAPTGQIFDGWTSGLTFAWKIEHVVPQWWGAVGDGAADDTAAVDAALSALITGGGTLFFPPGTYRLTSSLKLRSGIRYIGAGVGATILQAGTSNINVVGEPIPPDLGGGSYYSAENVEIAHLTIDGNAAALAFPTDDQYGNALRLNLVKRSRFHDLRIINSIFNAVSIYNESNDNEFHDIRIENVGKSGTPPGAWSMNGMFFEAGSSRNRVRAATIDGTLQYGIWIGARDLSNADNVISHSRIEGTTADGIRIGDDVDGVLAGPLVSRTTLDNVSVIDAGDFGIRAYHGGTGWVEGLRVLGGVVEGCASGGVLFDTRTRDGVLLGTDITGNGDYGLTAAGQDLIMSPGRLKGHTIDFRDLGTRVHWLGDVNPADGQQGTFTPTVLTGGAAVGRTYSAQEGTYRVSGNVVHFSIRAILTAKGSSTGTLTVSGLPFLAHAAGPFGTISLATGTVSVTPGSAFGLILNGENVIRLYVMSSGAPNAPMDDTHIANTSELYVTGSYGI